MISIAKEHFTASVFAEMLPLIRKCWDECTKIKSKTCAYHGDRDFMIEPYYEQYQKLQDEGCYVLITLRDAGVMRGYIEGFTYSSLHHKKVLCGMCDSIYIEPKYRWYIRSLITKFENEMRTLKAEIIGWPTTRKGKLYRLLRARGFTADDVVMEKRLCV